MAHKPILLVDFDGVIHSYTSGWKGADVIPDPPVPGALKWIFQAAPYFDVQVYSSRTKDVGGREAMINWMTEQSRLEFGPDHPMSKMPASGEEYPVLFPSQKPAAFLTIDDRAICFDGDWSKLNPESLLHFKPWNKKHE
jgi:hypothetical protein